MFFNLVSLLAIDDCLSIEFNEFILKCYTSVTVSRRNRGSERWDVKALAAIVIWNGEERVTHG